MMSNESSASFPLCSRAVDWNTKSNGNHFCATRRPQTVSAGYTSKYLANAGFELQVDFIASLACFQLLMNDVYESITVFLENCETQTKQKPYKVNSSKSVFRHYCVTTPTISNRMSPILWCASQISRRLWRSFRNCSCSIRISGI